MSRRSVSGTGLGDALVPSGTLLRAGTDGPVVGVARNDIGVPDEARFDGATVRSTRLGEVALWVGPEDVR